MLEDCDICGAEFDYEMVLCEMCEARLCKDCIAKPCNELVGLCRECQAMMAKKNPRECHHFDLEGECGMSMCPQKAVCRRIRQEAGSTDVEPLEMCGPEE